VKGAAVYEGWGQVPAQGSAPSISVAFWLPKAGKISSDSAETTAGLSDHDIDFDALPSFGSQFSISSPRSCSFQADAIEICVTGQSVPALLAELIHERSRDLTLEDLASGPYECLDQLEWIVARPERVDKCQRPQIMHIIARHCLKAGLRSQRPNFRSLSSCRLRGRRLVASVGGS
jgi:hypothetical protein